MKEREERPSNDHEIRLTIIEEALNGGMSGKAGIMQNMIRLIEDVYGKDTGLMARMQETETWQVKKDSWISGAHFMSSLVGSTLGVLIIWLLTTYVLPKGHP